MLFLTKLLLFIVFNSMFFSVKPVVVHPYCSAKFLSRYIVLNIFKGVPRFFFNICYDFSKPVILQGLKVIRDSVDFDCVGWELTNCLLSFHIPSLTLSLIVNLFITWSILQFAPIIDLELRKSDWSWCHIMKVVDRMQVFGSSEHPVLEDILVFEVGVCNDQLVFCTNE